MTLGTEDRYSALVEQGKRLAYKPEITADGFLIIPPDWKYEDIGETLNLERTRSSIITTNRLDDFAAMVLQLGDPKSNARHMHEKQLVGRHRLFRRIR